MVVLLIGLLLLSTMALAQPMQRVYNTRAAPGLLMACTSGDFNVSGDGTLCTIKLDAITDAHVPDSITVTQAGSAAQVAVRSLPNAATGGTTQNRLVRLIGEPSQATAALEADRNGLVGVCIAGCGTGGSATMVMQGLVDCAFDGDTTAGHYVVSSDSNPGACQDAGPIPPRFGQIIGRVTETRTGAGLAEVLLYGPGVEAFLDDTKLSLLGGTVSGPVQLQGATSTALRHEIGSEDTFVAIQDNANILSFTHICGGTPCVNKDAVAPAGGRFRWGGSFAPSILNIDGNSGAVSSTGALTVAGVLTGNLDVRLHTTTPVTLTAAQCRGSWNINNSNSAKTIVLPAAAVGLHCCFQTDFAQVFTVDTADTSDTIRLDGVALTAGRAIDSPATAGAFICMLAKDSATWNTAGRSGTWTAD